MAELAWRHPLHAFQLSGIERLLASDAALLADEMGLGKTIQAIGALRILVDEGKISSALVVVPVGLLLQWRQQFRAWAPELALATVTGSREERVRRWQSRAQVYLVGYEVLRNDRTLPAPFGPGRRVWDVVVADEAQRIKNEDTELSMVLKALHRRRAWALTGTPVENCAEDAASIIDFVAPGRLDRREMMHGLRGALGEVQLRRRRAGRTGSARPGRSGHMLICVRIRSSSGLPRSSPASARCSPIWWTTLPCRACAGWICRRCWRLSDITD